MKTEQFNNSGVYFYTMVEYYNNNSKPCFYYRGNIFNQEIASHCYTKMVEKNLQRNHNSDTCKTINTMYFKDSKGYVHTIDKAKIGF